MRLSIIGPGDTDYHYEKLLKLTKLQWRDHIDSIAAVIKELGGELSLVPSRGACFELARSLRVISDTSIVGIIPTDGEEPTSHQKTFMDATVKEKRVFSGFIETGDWYKQAHISILFGDVVLVLGYTLGSIGELMHGLYMYKLAIGDKPSVKTGLNKFHPKLRAGRNKKFSVIFYQPFIQDRLASELANYAIKHKVDILYAKTPEDLKRILFPLM